MNVHDKRLLETFGFSEVSQGLWVFRKHFDGADDDAVVIVTSDDDGAYRGYIPFVDDPVKTNAEDRVPDSWLDFESMDCRDIVALAQGEVGHCLSCTGEVAKGDNDGFEANGTFITMPFCGDPWGGYLIAGEIEGQRRLRLEAPSAAFGEAYIEWRNDFCAALATERHPSP